MKTRDRRIRRSVYVALIPLALLLIVIGTILTHETLQEILTSLGIEFLGVVILYLLLNDFLDLNESKHQEDSTKREYSADLLVKDSNENIYLVDKEGRPRRITDENTAGYFIEALGYSPRNIQTISDLEIDPSLKEVPKSKDWRLPKTPDQKHRSNLASEVRRHLRLNQRAFNAQSNSLGFHLVTDPTLSN